MILEAAAKINWFLKVVGKRDDGYHDIVSPMQRIGLFDTLSFEAADGLDVVSDLDIPVGDNLVFRAALLLKEVTGCASGARITLVKNIPSQAGLGGGSSDAAATLIGLNSLWGLGLSNRTLQELGARIGSDVPFFMGSPMALVEGRGDRVTPLRSVRSFPLLLVKPLISVSTPWAYGRLRILTKNSIDIKLFCQALDAGDFPALRLMAVNDLEQVVIPEHPEIAQIKSRLRECGAELSLMSGSGSVVFGVFRTRDEARRASKAFDGREVYLTDTIVDRE